MNYKQMLDSIDQQINETITENPEKCIKLTVWKSIVENCIDTNLCLAYKDFFFAVIPDNDEIAMLAFTTDLITEKIYDFASENISSVCYLVCYELLNNVGYPLLTARIPKIKLDPYDKLTQNFLDKLIEIYNNDSGITYEIV